MADQPTPKWVTKELFSSLLEQGNQNFKAIVKYVPTSAISKGENYLTIVLRIQIEMQLKDDSLEDISYILKIPLVPEDQENDFHDMFDAEQDMYDNLIPELENLYAQNTSISPKFKPVHLRFPGEPVKSDYILLEDLRVKGYRNADRTQGLEQFEVEAALKKLAQWHAASAKRVVELGEYDRDIRESYFTTEHQKLLDEFNVNFCMPFLECMQQYNLEPGQLVLISDYTSQLTDLNIEFGKNDPLELSVLNHGDFWCNNFMFKYRNASEVEDVCFVDFQLPKYGTPAQDLLCMLMTSPKFSIKLEKFDYFIGYYHQQLVEHLAMLNYNRNAPTLAQFHAHLHRYSLWAFICAQRMLPIVLLPPDVGSHIGNIMGNSEEATAFKRKMFLLPAYVDQIKVILPWLISRGYIR
ncbi:uncharacterized protein LOC6554927 isoform X1 [Drosophila erecta]|uniref:GG12253 n=1 Tax=Drosophila erecta TaxID=7220 RepID=B3P6K6_DROER|nr:uncharacterized protein LOC6554927 isoform X1 [Drosophila erecta]EDV53676.1 uncharacterized protein Dere_GG12253 [Drosophila erecta]